jgi:hypothetical protein
MENSPTTDARLILELRVQSGGIQRVGSLVDALLSSEDAQFARPAGEFVTTASLSALDGPRAGKPVAVQLDSSGRLSWLLEAPLEPNEARSYHCVIEKAIGGPVNTEADGVTIRLAGDHVWFTRGNYFLTRYVYLGNWKPYFWPILVRAGNVVRGASAEHQHQTGLFLAYGGHGGAGTTNVWSDWDEPPYGPCGKIVHLGFDYLEGGPVYGRFVERVIYTRPDGPRLFGEIRDIRLVPLTDGSLLFDVVRRAERPAEAGPWPFIFSARVADSLRLVDLSRTDENAIPLAIERPGTLIAPDSPVLETPTMATYRTHGSWLDWNGTIGGAVAGLAFFDHPQNPGKERGITAAGYGCMTLTREYPESLVAEVRSGALAHDGNAEEARVSQRYLDYTQPPMVGIEVIHRPSLSVHGD